ncbi:hypothetical protein BH09ACT10_BH09ACT10_20840 [soil metagenome]
MARTLSATLGAVVEELELEQPQVVTMQDLQELLDRADIKTDAKVVAHRLRQSGWLLDSGVRGVWEFAPGAHAGPIGHQDPLGQIKAFSSRHATIRPVLALASAAWATGHADRVPPRPEVTIARGAPTPKPLAAIATVTHFDAYLKPLAARGMTAHRPETVLVHMADRPNDVRSWASAREWMANLAADANLSDVLVELDRRPSTTHVRLGYLMQSLRPDIAKRMESHVKSKTWFGPRASLRRHSSTWQVADTLLPFDPAQLTPAP